jgi:hypothetical protein
LSYGKISIPFGSVFMDNTTLHEASLEGLYPDFHTVGYISLAQLVEAIALHEKIFVSSDMLRYDFEAKEIITQLNGVVEPLSIDLFKDDIYEELRFDYKFDVLLDKWDTVFKDSPLFRMMPPPINGRDRQEPDILLCWNQMDRFSVRLRTFHGKREIPPETWDEFMEVRIARTLYYYLFSKTLDIPYLPNVARAPFLLQITRLMGPNLKDPADKAMQILDEIRKKYAKMLTDTFGIPAFGTEIPLFLRLAVKDANTVEEVISNSLKIRELKYVKSFRNWVTRLTEELVCGNVRQVVTSLEDLEKIRNDLFDSLKTERSISFGVGFPPSISTDPIQIVGKKRQLWFLSDLVEQSIQVRDSEKDLQRILDNVLRDEKKA